jgi:hypothetical protein
MGVILANFGIFRPSSALDYVAGVATGADGLCTRAKLGQCAPLVRPPGLR